MTRTLLSEALGTLILVMCGIGTGIMGMTLAGGTAALALLANAMATGLILYLLITILGPVSGAHINPAVTLYMLVTRQISGAAALGYVLAQILGGLLAVPLTHAMFGQELVQIATTARPGASLALSEFVATFGLCLTIAGALRHAPAQTPALVGAWIAAAFWFTGSASFANPVVTLARVFSDTATGIRAGDAPAFVIAELLAAALAGIILPRLFSR